MEHKHDCDACGHKGPLTSILREQPSVHYAEWRCPECNKYHGFIPKRDGEKKGKREGAHRELVKKYSRGCCEMCLVKESDLRKNRTLEAHHIIEYQDGGTSDRENLWIVCTACHQHIHWIRTYHGTIEPLGDNLTSWMDDE